MTTFFHQNKGLWSPLTAPIGSHPQAFNLLPWRAQFIHYRWQRLRYWLGGLIILSCLWAAGLFLLNGFYNQQLAISERLLQHTKQQTLAKIQHAQQQKDPNIGQAWLLKQLGINAWQQSTRQQNWLGVALQTIQDHAAAIDGDVRTWRLQPDGGEFSLMAGQPWHQINHALVLPASLRITSVRSTATDTGISIDIHSVNNE